MSHTFFTGKNVLITGVAGFIGSHLADAVIAQGGSVLGVDNFSTGSAENIIHLELDQRFRFIEADVADKATYLPDDYVPDVVLHMASPASPPLYQAQPQATYMVNAFGTHYLLTWLVNRAPQACFLFASTSEVYGDPLVHPQPESYWGNVNPNGIRSCYDEAKRLGETITGIFHREHGINTRIIRIFNTYGPRMDINDGRVIPNFIKQAEAGKSYTIYGDGTQTRSYCYVSDLVDGITRFVLAEGMQGKTLNLGNPGEFTIQQTAELVHRLFHPNTPFTSSNQPLPSDDPIRRQPDISRARKLLGWEPSVGLAEGLKLMIEWYRDHQTQKKR